LCVVIVVVVVVVVVGGGTIGGSGCSSCGLRFEGVVIVVDVDVDVTTAAVVFFDATISRHKGFEEINYIINTVHYTFIERTASWRFPGARAIGAVRDPWWRGKRPSVGSVGRLRGRRR